jgi:hypothetical protein
VKKEVKRGEGEEKYAREKRKKRRREAQGCLRRWEERSAR